MPRIQHSIDINRRPVDVFAITNDIDNWHSLFDEYGFSQVIKRENSGRFTKLVFRLRNNDGAEWQSWRILDSVELVAIAERDEPLFPFRYMHLKWTYTPVGNGTRMTWTQDFELDPAADIPEAAAMARMDAHGRENQQRIKRILEASRTTAVG